MHDASAFAVTPETKLHRPTDLHACVKEEEEEEEEEEEGLGLVDCATDRLHRLFSPGGEMCTVGWSAERGFCCLRFIDPQTSRGQHAWQILHPNEITITCNYWYGKRGDGVKHRQKTLVPHMSRAAHLREEVRRTASEHRL
jgi:hypothetical protein